MSKPVNQPTSCCRYLLERYIDIMHSSQLMLWSSSCKEYCSEALKDAKDEQQKADRVDQLVRERFKYCPILKSSHPRSLEECIWQCRRIKVQDSLH